MDAQEPKPRVRIERVWETPAGKELLRCCSDGTAIIVPSTYSVEELRMLGLAALEAASFLEEQAMQKQQNTPDA